MSEVNVTKQNFNEELEVKEKIVIVDFFATWCGPCQMLAPVLSKIAEEHKEKVKVCKVNVDDEQELAMKYNVVSIPTLVIFKNGEIKNTIVGLRSKSELENIINTI